MNAKEICVSSFSNDNTVQIWDVNDQYFPKYVVKSHKDIVTGFAFDSQEKYIVTGSKDQYMVRQLMSSCIQPFQICGKSVLKFDKENQLIFRSEFQQRDTFFIDSQYKPRRNLTTIEDIDLDGKVQMSPREALKYFANNYKTKGQLEDIVEHNQKIAFDNNKQEIADIWKFFLLTTQNSVLKHNNYQIYNKTEELTDINQSSIQDTQQSLNYSQYKQNHEISNINHPKSHLDLHQLFKYFECYPDKFKQDLAEKKIFIQNNSINIKSNYIQYYITLLENHSQFDIKQKESKLQTQLELINQTLINKLQDLIDQGELQHAYIIYQVFKHKIKLSDDQIKRWTQPYIDLLLQNKFYISSNQTMQESELQKVRDFNRTSGEIFLRCLRCRKIMDSDGSPICHNCKTFTKCSLCKLPIKQMVLWCQICSHGGHIQCLTEWFKENQECPTGCGHKCFQV